MGNLTGTTLWPLSRPLCDTSQPLWHFLFFSKTECWQNISEFYVHIWEDVEIYLRGFSDCLNIWNWDSTIKNSSDRISHIPYTGCWLLSEDELCEQILSKSSDTNQFHGHFLPRRKITVVRERDAATPVWSWGIKGKIWHLSIFYHFFVFQHEITKKVFASPTHE